MGEFAENVRQQATETLRTLFQMEPDLGADPAIELITSLLEDGAGGVNSPQVSPVTLEQWITWNRLVTAQPKALSRTLTRDLNHEKVALPTEPEAMRSWAAQMLL